jgi:hypothetical protein
VFHDLRRQVLTLTPDAAGVEPTAALPDVWAVIMDWGVGNGVATVVAIADGTLSLYLSSGGGVIGAGQQEGPRRAAQAFLAAGQALHGRLLPAPDSPLPKPNEMAFTVRTYGDTLRAVDGTQALSRPGHALHALFAAGQAVVTALRQSG